MKSYYKLIRHDGNQELFRAVEMSVLALTNGYPFHIHAQGLRGTGKTSIMRSVKDILPPIVRIKNCIYNCHPAAPHCPDHRNLSPDAIASIGTEMVPCPFFEISHSAKIGTVVGSIDLTKLTDKTNPVAAVLPGTIPKAHRGIIFVDEINRLADTSPEIADVLLDLMGTKPGRIQIEETGLPTVELPVSVAVWAASNPDEDPGPLVQIRKQLADRFDLAVNMGRPSEYQAVIDILEKRNQDWTGIEVKSSNVTGKLSDIVSDSTIRNVFASIYVDFGLESLRAVESMEAAAGLSALISGRTVITLEDISGIVPLALSHRADNGTITGILRYLDSLSSSNLGKKTLEPIKQVKKLEEYTNTEESHTVKWWQQFWSGCKHVFRLNRFGSNPIINPPLPKSDNAKPISKPIPGKMMKSNNQSSPQANTYNLHGTSKPSHNGQNASGENNIADPTQTQISAPPNKAVPLSNLSIEQFVASEDK